MYVLILSKLRNMDHSTAPNNIIIGFLQRNTHLLIALLLLCLCLYFWGTAVFNYAINPDAGYYLGAGKFIAQGLEPYQDFHTSYSPGVYYIFALAELMGSTFGEYQKAFIYLLHIINGALFGLLLLNLTFKKDIAIFGCLLLILATFTLDGQALVLEPFQNFFILASLVAAVKWTEYKAVIVVGLLFGFALMAKQSSMFSFPVLACLVLFPHWFGIAKSQPLAPVVSRILVLGVSSGIAFLLFCIVTQQNLVTTLYKLITFGGRAQSYVAQEYGLYDVVNTFIKGEGGERLLIPMIVAGAYLFITTTNRLHRLFVVGFAINLVTILMVRGYPHYMQLIVPWGILIFMALISEYELERAKLRSVLALLIVSQFILPVFITAQNLRVDFDKNVLAEQKLLTKQVNDALAGDNHKTIVVGYPWLYYTSNITPPEYDLSFVKAIDKLQASIKLAEQVIVMPGYQEMFEQVYRELSAEKFNPPIKLPYENDWVLIYTTNTL
jgi:hypothetical protein